MGMETLGWKQGHQDEPVETLGVAWGHMNAGVGMGMGTPGWESWDLGTWIC